MPHEQISRFLTALSFATLTYAVLMTAPACGSRSGGPTGPSTVHVESTVPPLPPPVPAPPPPPPPGLRAIVIGEELSDTLMGHGDQKFYQVTAPFDGTLVLRVGWDHHQGILSVKVENTWFQPSPGDGSALVAEMAVDAGRSYMVRIADAAPWDYDDLRLPFVVTARMK